MVAVSSSFPLTIVLLWFIVAVIVFAKNSDFKISFKENLGLPNFISTCSPSSSALQFPNRNYGRVCGDENETPSLMWTDAPSSTQSYAIVIRDLNATDQRPNLLAWNIKNHINAISETVDWKDTGAIIAKGQNGRPKYQGPCPNSGDDFHCIDISIYALAEMTLPLTPSTDLDDFQSHLLYLGDQKKVLATATLYCLAVPHERYRISTT